MSADPVAFLSYVRFDDQHNDGRISTLRQRLEGEIRAVTGREVRILQDRQDIAWGNVWKQWIDESLGAVAFLIPVVTPSFFQSAACRDEFEQFRAREQKLGRGDLILPIYFIDADEINDEATRDADAIAAEIARRQYADWRDLRFEPLTTATAGKRLETMARQLKAALPSVQSPPAPPRRRARPVESESSAHAVEIAAPTTPTARNEPPTCIVDAMGLGDFTKLTEAVAASRPGTRLLVRPGLYEGGIVLDKPLEIIGDGPRDQITVAATGENVIRFETTMGRVSGLTLHQRGGDDAVGVSIPQGRLILEDCDVRSESLACIEVANGADPIVRGNRIRDGKKSGVYVHTDARGTYEDNEVSGNGLAGFEVKTGADPVVRGNRIRDGKQGGVSVHTDGRGTYEDNEVSGNAYSGFEVSEGADPIVRGNRIRDGKQNGVLVHTDGRGTYEDNEVSGNAYAGFEVKTGADLVVRGNRITANGYEGIWVYDGGKGTYERNHLWDNARGPWDIAEDAGEVTRSGNVEAAPI